MKFCRKEICEGCWGDLPPSHGPACFMNCMHGCVHALQSRAKEREIIVDPIQCLVHPFDKPEKNLFFPHFLPISTVSSMRAKYRQASIGRASPDFFSPSSDSHSNHICRVSTAPTPTTFD